MTEELIRVVAVALGVPLLLGVLYWLSRGSSVQEPGEGTTIRPNPKVLAFVGVLAMGMAGIFVTLMFVQDDAGFGLLAGGFVLGTVLLVSGLHRDYRVTWDADGVRGPRSVHFPPFGRKQERIVWRDITALERGLNQRWILRAGPSRKIEWSDFYTGYGDLIQALQAHRPDLFADTAA